MNEYFYLYITIILAVMSTQYIQSIIFVLFKANKYEDTLAKKIAKEIKND